jgi:hypothetical protein
VTTTVFTNGVTLTDAGWFNDVDAIAYDGLTTQILVGGGSGVLGIWTTATGSGSPVRATTPTLVTPVIGVATGTSLALTGALTGASAVITAAGVSAPVTISQSSDSTNLGAVHFSATKTNAGMTGLLGDGSSGNLFLMVPTGNVVSVRSNNANVMTLQTGAVVITGAFTTQVVGATNPIALGVRSDATTYGIISFNNAFSAGAYVGIIGGGGADKNLYLDVPTAGLVLQRVNNTTVTSAASTGLTVTGTLSVSTGAAVGGATAGTGGVAFPATAVAVADVNTLDDYEEGTWTPSLGGSTTYTSRTGTYTKVGKKVTLSCIMVINAIGTGSTTVVSGLPFTSANESMGAVYWTTAATSIVYATAHLAASAATIQIVSATASATSLAVNAFFGSGTTFITTVTYEV